MRPQLLEEKKPFDAKISQTKLLKPLSSELQSPILNSQVISNPKNRTQVTNTKRKSQSMKSIIFVPYDPYLSWKSNILYILSEKTQHPLPETTPGSRLEFPRDLKRVHCRLFDGLR